jgi:hypothetical protein
VAFLKRPTKGLTGRNFAAGIGTLNLLRASNIPRARMDRPPETGSTHSISQAKGLGRKAVWSIFWCSGKNRSVDGSIAERRNAAELSSIVFVLRSPGRSCAVEQST